MSKANYLITIPGGLAVTYLLAIVAWLNHWALLYLLIAAAFFSMALLMIFILTYKMWSAIQDGQARATALQALLYNFIPVFNAYWLFQSIWGFSKDANAYIRRHQLSTPLLPTGVFFWYTLLWFVSALPYIGLVTVPVCIALVSIIVSRTIDLVNYIRTESLHA